jgi:DNA-binding cell septation regulator SpoVG
VIVLFQGDQGIHVVQNSREDRDNQSRDEATPSNENVQKKKRFKFGKK